MAAPGVGAVPGYTAHGGFAAGGAGGGVRQTDEWHREGGTGQERAEGGAKQAYPGLPENGTARFASGQGPGQVVEPVLHSRLPVGERDRAPSRACSGGAGEVYTMRGWK